MNKLLIGAVGIYIVYFGAIQILLYGYRKKKGSNPLNYQLFRIYPKKLIQNEVSHSCKRFYSMSNIISGLFYIMICSSLLAVVVIVYCENKKNMGIPSQPVFNTSFQM